MIIAIIQVYAINMHLHSNIQNIEEKKENETLESTHYVMSTFRIEIILSRLYRNMYLHRNSDPNCNLLTTWVLFYSDYQNFLIFC